MQELLGRAAWHREQLEAEAAEFVDWHGYEVGDGSREADELEAVIWDGVDYSEAIIRVMKAETGDTKWPDQGQS